MPTMIIKSPNTVVNQPMMDLPLKNRTPKPIKSGNITSPNGGLKPTKLYNEKADEITVFCVTMKKPRPNTNNPKKKLSTSPRG